MRDALLRNHFNKFPLFFLRKKLRLWGNKTRPSSLTPSQIANMYKNLRNKINQPFFKELRRRLNKLPKKGLKQKIIRNLLNRKNKIYNEIVLKEYLTRWRDIHRKLAIQEFKTIVFDKFLFRTKKAIIKRKVGNALRLWYFKSNKKIDLEKVNEFLENLKKTMKRHAYFTCKKPIENCVEGIKSRTTRALFGLKGKFALLKLRKYLNLWKTVLVKIAKRELQVKMLTNLKTKNFTFGLYKIFAGRFQDWRRKANILAYLEKQILNDTVKTKGLATKKMCDALKRYARKKGFSAFYPKLKTHLNDIIKSKALKQMAKMDPKFNKLLLRRYCSLWKNVVSMLRKKEFRNKFFNKLLGNASTNFRRNFLRAFFQKWLRNKHKNPLSSISEGCKVLKDHCLIFT